MHFNLIRLCVFLHISLFWNNNNNEKKTTTKTASPLQLNNDQSKPNRRETREGHCPTLFILFIAYAHFVDNNSLLWSIFFSLILKHFFVVAGRYCLFLIFSFVCIVALFSRLPPMFLIALRVEYNCKKEEKKHSTERLHIDDIQHTLVVFVMPTLNS